MEDYPAAARRRAAVGLGHHPDDGGAVVRDAGRRRWPRRRRSAAPVLVALGERDVLVDPRGELRAYESSPERGLLRLPAHGAHAQLRRDAGAVLAAHRDVGGLGAGWRAADAAAGDQARAVGTGDGARAGRRPGLAADARAGRPRPVPGPQRQLRSAPDPLRRAGGGPVPAWRPRPRSRRTASPTRSTATSCAPGAATCRSSSRSTATATGAPSRPATSWPCRRARSSSPWSRRSTPRREGGVFDDAPAARGARARGHAPGRLEPAARGARGHADRLLEGRLHRLRLGALD